LHLAGFRKELALPKRFLELAQAEMRQRAGDDGFMMNRVPASK
jgi:hypothetical protein